MDYKQLEGTRLGSLPIIKHFSEGEIKLNPQEWRKGEFGLFTVLALAAAVVGGYLLWVYVLPILGMILQLCVAGGVALLLVLAREAIFKFFKNIARTMHKAVIKHDPFGELENQAELMKQNEKKFVAARGKIAGLRDQMKIEASKQQEEAEKLSLTIISLHVKSKDLLSKKKYFSDNFNINDLTPELEEEYTNLVNEIDLNVSEAERSTYLYEQAKDFTVKYGARGVIMAKLDRKLSRVATKIKIKIQDFLATIVILKRDSAFAENARQATDAANSAIGNGDKSWKLDYAMDVITSTIATDISITQNNLSDIDMLTSNFSIDDDAMFAKLDKVANNIQAGDDVVVKATKYNNPEYKLNSEDKIKSGGFGNIFDN